MIVIACPGLQAWELMGQAEPVKTLLEQVFGERIITTTGARARCA